MHWGSQNKPGTFKQTSHCLVIALVMKVYITNLLRNLTLISQEDLITYILLLTMRKGETAQSHKISFVLTIDHKKQ